MELSRDKSNPSLGVGIEIARFLARVVVLDLPRRRVLQYAERPMAGSVSFNYFSDLAPALRSLWLDLGLSAGSRVAVSLGSPHSGIGSGPAINGWVDSLEDQIDRKMIKAGSAEIGISYMPTKHLYDLLNAFKPVGVVPESVELAPVSLARVVPTDLPCTVSIDSGIGWRARLHSGYVLEALAYPEGFDDEELDIAIQHKDASEFSRISSLIGVSYSEEVKSAMVTAESLALATGAALGLKEPIKPNFVESLHGSEVSFSKPGVSKIDRSGGSELDIQDTQRLAAVKVSPSYPRALNSLVASSVEERKREDASVVSVQEREVPLPTGYSANAAVEKKTLPEHTSGSPSGGADILRWYILFLIVLSAVLWVVWRIGL